MRGEDKAGLYITVIFHLVIIIVLLACQIGAAMKGENTFVLDFTKQEEVEKKKAEENFKEEVSDRLDQLLASASGVPIRNIAVDRSSTLKDDRNTNAEQLYKDAERLAQELKDGFKADEPDDDYVAVNKPVVKRKTRRSSLTAALQWSLILLTEGRPAGCPSPLTDALERVMSQSSSQWIHPVTFLTPRCKRMPRRPTGALGISLSGRPACPSSPLRHRLRQDN